MKPKTNLINAYEFSEIQVKAILSMPLSRLTNLEQQKLIDEKKELNETIKDLKEILDKKDLRLDIIKNELNELIKKLLL